MFWRRPLLFSWGLRFSGWWQRIRPKRAYVLHLPLPQADELGLEGQIQQSIAGCTLPVTILGLGQRVDPA